jgi:mono/diheme cytochrome c family protein
MTSKRALTVLAASWIVVAQMGSHRTLAAGQTLAAPAAASAAASRAVLDKYCVSCHNQKTRTADLALDHTVDVSLATGDPEVWEKVIRKVRLGAMPPRGLPRPDKATADAMVAHLETELDRRAAQNPDPGRVETFHRLNRAEYKNAIRDLLVVDVDVASLLPADDSDKHGFDNVASTLSVSPTLLERYIAAARKVSRVAVGVAPPAPGSDTYRGIVLELDDDWLNASEDLPFGSRGGVAIRHQFPVDGEYALTIRLRRSGYDYIVGLGEKHQLEVRLDGALVKSFTVGGEAKGRPAPYGFTGNVAGDTEWETYVLGFDKALNLRFRAAAGPRVVGVAFVSRPTVVEGVRQRPESVMTNASQYDNPFGNPAVESVKIEGPYNVTGTSETPSRKRLFVCQPKGRRDEDTCAKQILTTLARRAYRRPATDREVETLLGFYRTGRSEGSFDAGIELAVERVLADPNFLFRIERDPANAGPGTPYRIADLELASRLSFFLWSSIPDDELLDVAARGKLKEPAVLSQQVRRMIADPRSSALVENFVGQWLHLRNLAGAQPDDREFPDFDETLRRSLRRETELFVESTIREDRSVVELLTANYTFVNERLARHYEIPDISGEAFRRFTFAADAQRGGLLAHGSLLTVTSYPTRTSPVLRGKWLLETILGSPPPPPPPNVPGLPDRGEGNKPASVRERLEQHRKNPVCATCHAPMDPLGFALENFDGIGKWRTATEAGSPVDAKGTFVNGIEFEGIAGLRSFLVANKEAFVETLIQKLLAYALGRELHAYDMPTVRKIQKTAAASDHRWSALLLGIAISPPFQMRKSVEAPAPQSAASLK